MANRSFYPMLASLVDRLTVIQGEFNVGASGAVSGVKGNGVKSVTKGTAAGSYLVRLQDTFNKCIGGSAIVVPGAAAMGTPVATGSLSAGVIYVISAVGTVAKGASTITISSGAGLITATVNGFSASVTWATSDAATATALSTAMNAVAGIAAAVSTSPSTNTVVITALTNPGNSIPCSVTGTGATISSALTTGGTTTAAEWAKTGFPVGNTPAVGQAFVATGSVATITSGTAAPQETTIVIPDVEFLGDLDLCAKMGSPSQYGNGLGAQFFLQLRGPTGVVADATSGSVVKFGLLFRNSAVKGAGE